MEPIVVPLLSTTLRPQFLPWVLFLSTFCSSLANLEPGVGGTNNVVVYLSSLLDWFLLNQGVDFFWALLASCSAMVPLGLLM